MYRATMTRFLPLAAVSLLILSSSPSSVAAITSEKDILIQFYDMLNGPTWLEQDGWAEPVESLCSWHGVTCADGTKNDENGVTSINLEDNNLVGTVTPLLYQMPSLRTINLRGNSITDAGFSTMVQLLEDGQSLGPLRIIILSENSLTDLEGVGKLPNSVRELHFTSNRLQGPVPSELFTLKKLRKLYLSFNDLSGAIPTDIGQMGSLLELYCYGNRFTGPLPTQLGNLDKIQVVTFAENVITGDLPTQLGNMLNLRTFSVHNNEKDTGSITGPLPAFENLVYLTELYLDGNALTGPIPSTFLKHSKVTNDTTTVTLGLSNNQMTGVIPGTLSKFDSLVLNVVGNKFTGIQHGLCDQKQWMNGLVELYDCDAILCPEDMYNALGRQQTDDDPCVVCPSGTDGLLGATKCGPTPGLTDLEILADVYAALDPQKWKDTSGWDALEGIDGHEDLVGLGLTNVDPCGFLGVSCNDSGEVSEIELHKNGLHGLVPVHIYQLSGLTRLDLSGNELQMDKNFGFGKISDATKLEYLDLSSANIETWAGIENAPSTLKELHVDDAYFWGPITDEVFQLTNLEIFHCQFAGITDALPTKIGQMTNLRALNLYGNEISGPIPSELGLLSHLWHLDLSENSFAGHIPAEIGDLIKLEKFHAHQSDRNNDGLTGPLPSFTKFTKLHTLSLNSNSMTGPIPSDFLSGITNTNQAMTVSLSYNKFNGVVPGGLDRFSNMNIDLVMNEFTAVSTDLCVMRDWMEGEVGDVIDAGGDGCDAILCPKGAVNAYGRATKELNGAKCFDCPSAQFAGMTWCDPTNVNQDPYPEKTMLEDIYHATGGRNWEQNKANTWLINGAGICSYEGVTCDPDDGANNEGVVKLELDDFGLSGIIPDDIFQKLPSLKVLTLSRNAVDLNFAAISDADNLEVLDVSDTDLTSLNKIWRAPSLKELDISQNDFTGKFPEDIFSMDSLESLHLNYNHFSGTVSPGLSALINLKEFWAEANDFTGHLPASIGDLDDLEVLVLAENKLSGFLPPTLGQMGNLRRLELYSQRSEDRIFGPLIDFDNNPDLRQLNLRNNALSGAIPSSFLSNTDKSIDDVSIDLSFNELTGSIPTSLVQFDILHINLVGNMIDKLDTTLCQNDEWMDGLVGDLEQSSKCDAIMCPKGESLPKGRQTVLNEPCVPCSPNTQEALLQAPYFGSTKCTLESEVAERGMLVELYQALNGTFWLKQNGWLSDKPICQWFGIVCDDETADYGVTSLKMENNAISVKNGAPASELLFKMPGIELIDLKGNDIQLSFDQVGLANNLKVLYLSGTDLTSLSGIGAASNLRELHVTDNKLKGKLPDELFTLTNLERLFLSFNELSGSIPATIGDLTKLKELYAYRNQLSGTIPDELGSLTDLEYLVMGENMFTGSLPTTLNNLVNLKELSFYHQKKNDGLEGELPDFAALSKLTNLDMEFNKLSGTIPTTLLSQSDARGSDDAITINLAHNMLTGIVPKELDGFQNLYLDVVGNRLNKVADELCDDDNAGWMKGKVGDIQSCSAIACPPGTFSATGRQETENAQCTPCDDFEQMEFIGSTFCVQLNIERVILEAIYDSTNGDNWKEKENWKTSAPICSWFGVDCENGVMSDETGVTSLSLPNNGLVGTVPEDVYELQFLENLNLKQNGVYMAFEHIDNAIALELLYISEIDISDIAGIGKAPALKEIHLTGNSLSGTLPDDIFDLAGTLEQLYIAYNTFSGTLSTRFGELTKLTDFYAFDNEFSGEIPSEIGRLTDLIDFVVAENLISGELPDEIGSMPNLELFSVYRRAKSGPKIDGPLPSFASVPKLTDLYLDHNHITGLIPQDFLSASTSTNLVTISHNQLFGKVPIEMDNIKSLNIQMEGNRITELPPDFCDNDEWMNGALSEFGCTAILCEPHTASPIGRQNTTDTECQECDEDDEAPFWGSLSCDTKLSEKEILELLYDTCGGTGWWNQDNWKESDDICEWYGVSCTDRETVHAIRLGSNNLQGTPPEQLFDLKELHWLWLHSNPITFSFDGIERAINLGELRLDSTGLSSVSGVEMASSLKILDLRFNRISGPFPEEVLALKNLESLSLADNKLTGPVPTGIDNLLRLQTLRLGSNKFTGTLPAFDGTKRLRAIDLSDNDLTGSIKSTFLNSLGTTRPVEVDISSNRLSGGIPMELDRFKHLTIYLRDNQFTTLSLTLCDHNNRFWNEEDVKAYGCDGLMCPPGTYNQLGRQSTEDTPCIECEKEADSPYYGQVTCDTSGSDAWRMISSGQSYAILTILSSVVSWIVAEAIP